MLGGVRYLHAEEELVPVIEVQLIDAYVGKAFVVHKYAIVVDSQRFQQTVLVPVGEPPVRREQSPHICVVPGACPDADKCIIQIEMYIRRPVFIAAGRLGGEFGGNGNLVDFVVIGDDARNLVFHIASGKPENIRLKMLLMREIAGVVDFTDHRGGGGDPAGRVDLVGGVLSGAQIRLIFVIILDAAVQNEKDFVQMRLAQLQIAVNIRIRGDPDQISTLELTDVVRQSTVCDIELLCELIHTHFATLQQQIQDRNPDL